MTEKDKQAALRRRSKQLVEAFTDASRHHMALLWISSAEGGVKARINLDPLTLEAIEELFGRERAENWADKVTDILRKAAEDVAREFALLGGNKFEIRTEELSRD